MRKILAIALALMLLACLTACGGTNPDTNAPANTGGSSNSGEPAPSKEDTKVYGFLLEEVELVPGADFDPAALPEASSVYQVPSCALEGSDNVYNYESVEVTAFDDGTGEIIYSIYVVDPNTPTTEGLYLGDDLAQVDALYGTDRTENDGELIYQGGSTMLIIIMENDTVSSIEYRAVVE